MCNFVIVRSTIHNAYTGAAVHVGRARIENCSELKVLMIQGAADDFGAEHELHECSCNGLELDAMVLVFYQGHASGSSSMSTAT